MAINYATLIGRDTVRRAVMGTGAVTPRSRNWPKMNRGLASNGGRRGFGFSPACS